MPHSIENVVFDMGGVLMNFDGRYFASRFAENDSDAEAIDEALFSSGSPWALLDAGVIGEPTMERMAKSRLPERLHPTLHECFAHWHEYSDPFPAANALVKRLKDEGFGVYLLSNAGLRFTEQSKNMTAFPLMDGWVVSAFERVMKPDPAIYELLCARYELAPERCLFVDDNADNVRGAKVAGMQGFHYVGDAAALERFILGS